MNTHAIGYGYGPGQATRSAYTIAEFCAEHRVSRTHLYELCKAGRGPRLMKLGRRVLISIEAAADWRRQIEVETTKAGTPEGVL